MNTEKLFAMLNDEKNNSQAEQNRIETLIQTELNKRFDDWSALQKAITDSESATEYQWNRCGEIERWFRFSGLSDIDEQARPFLENYLSDRGIFIDWDTECFHMSEGDCIIIQDESRHDNGVWDNGKKIIDDEEYKTARIKCDECGHEEEGVDRTQCPNCDGTMYETEKPEVNESLRNELIEAYMEKIGCFPAVLRSDYHGNLYPVNTQKKGK